MKISNECPREYAISSAKANVYALALFIPIFALYFGPYIFIYGGANSVLDFAAFFQNIPVFLGCLIVGTAVHELIHAASWFWLAGTPWRDIHFGMKWSTLTPYVHCPMPVEVTKYRWSVAMPGIVLGVMPYILALVFRNGWLFGFGTFFTLAAGGDMLILWLLRDVRRGTLVRDHLDLVGCEVVDPHER